MWPLAAILNNAALESGAGLSDSRNHTLNPEAMWFSLEYVNSSLIHMYYLTDLKFLNLKICNNS